MMIKAFQDISLVSKFTAYSVPFTVLCVFALSVEVSLVPWVWQPLI